MKEGIFDLWNPLMEYIFEDKRKDKEIHICELGTHKGRSSYQICKFFLGKGMKVYYTGYDLFESATRETDVAERNGKGAGNYAMAEWHMKRLQQLYGNNMLIYKLVKGFSQDTLDEQTFDFVFLDGGHSYETVKHDHKKLIKSKYVLFDDYNLPDVGKYVDEFLAEEKIETVDWDFDAIAKMKKTICTFVPYKKNKKPIVIGKPLRHQQPVVIRNA